jgi:hypothetical protein
MYEPYEVYEFWIAFSFCCLNLFHGEEKHHPIVLLLTYQIVQTACAQSKLSD